MLTLRNKFCIWMRTNLVISTKRITAISQSTFWLMLKQKLVCPFNISLRVLSILQHQHQWILEEAIHIFQNEHCWVMKIGILRGSLIFINNFMWIGLSCCKIVWLMFLRYNWLKFLEEVSTFHTICVWSRWCSIIFPIVWLLRQHDLNRS